VSAPRIDDVQVAAYTIPTEDEQESDGTLVWDSTTIVVVQISSGGHTGLGYTYTDPSCAQVIEGKLAPVVGRADPLAPQKTWARMQVQSRQLGHDGINAMAVSAVDIALWDLKARLLEQPLALILPRFRDSVPIYGSGGFTSLSADELREQVRGWVAEGIPRIKIKVGRDKPADVERVRITAEAAGEGVEVMVDGNGAYTPAEAVEWAHRFREEGVRWFEEPVSSDDLAGLRHVREHAPAGLQIAAGEYGWNLPYFERMLAAGAVDVLQADVTRCGGITNLIRLDGMCAARCLPLSAHCAPAISAHACCALETVRHIEYFFDHTRIESMLFTGTLDPAGGELTPDLGRPGLGLALKPEAERHRA
jgi:L-alanine-DL-glutamate epimerase-like enolase superfamily enzyme